MAPVAAPDQINPGIEEVVADAKLPHHGDQTMVINMGPQRSESVV